MKYTKYYLLALAVIIIDQATKLAVHNYMELDSEISIFGNWFKLHYTLNAGMAFGIQLGEKYGKLFLTIFRLISMVAIAWYLYTLAKNKEVHRGFVWAISAILGGAVGNIIDSVFYGLFLENNALELVDAPFIHPLFYGKVVDMFYFDIARGHWPDYIPLIGGDFYAFWPIFNVADSAIFLGVATILIRQKAFLAHQNPNPNPTNEPIISRVEPASE